MFYAPNLLGHPDNYIPANPLQTPPHIVPEWYFLPFYAILRAIPSKLFGVAGLIGSIAILFFVPWLDTSRVRSTRYRPIYKWFFWAFVVTCFVLGYLGSQPPEGVYLVLGRIFTAYYFLFFLLVMPVVGWIEKPKGLPGSITESVLGPQEAPAGLAEARAAAPCAGAGGMRMHPPFGLALAVGLVSALALSPRAAFAAEDKPQDSPQRKPSPQPKPQATRRRSSRRIGPSPARSAPMTTPSFSAATPSTRMSARPAIRCGSCPTAISASLADPDSRRKRSRRSPPKRR